MGALLLFLLLHPEPAPGPSRVLRRDPIVSAASGEGEERLTLVSSAGDTVHAFLRLPPRQAGGSVSGIVLLAGRHAGRRALAAMPSTPGSAVLTLEYPGSMPGHLEAWQWIQRLPAIRRSALAVPDLLRTAARYLAQRPEIDGSRLLLAGVSLGVPFAARAGSDRIFRGVALHHGGGDLKVLLGSALPVRPILARRALGLLVAWYFAALDPAEHVGAIAPTPLLLVNGEQDVVIPRRAVASLWTRARPPVRRLWLPHAHVSATDTALVRELVDTTYSHFAFLRSASPPSLIP